MTSNTTIERYLFCPTCNGMTTHECTPVPNTDVHNVLCVRCEQRKARRREQQRARRAAKKEATT